MRLPPAGDLQDRPPVVRLEFGRRYLKLLSHERRPRPPPANATATPVTSTPAATPAQRHIAGRSLVVTTGSGGSPYTCGSSSSRKNAPVPPTPSSGSSPYSLASVTPAACSSATRALAVSLSSSSGPNWIESVGQALAQAGSSPPRSRS